MRLPRAARPFVSPPPTTTRAAASFHAACCRARRRRCACTSKTSMGWRFIFFSAIYSCVVRRMSSTFVQIPLRVARLRAPTHHHLMPSHGFSMDHRHVFLRGVRPWPRTSFSHAAAHLYLSFPLQRAPAASFLAFSPSSLYHERVLDRQFLLPHCCLYLYTCTCFFLFFGHSFSIAAFLFGHLLSSFAAHIWWTWWDGIYDFRQTVDRIWFDKSLYFCVFYSMYIFCQAFLYIIINCW